MRERPVTRWCFWMRVASGLDCFWISVPVWGSAQHISKQRASLILSTPLAADSFDHAQTSVKRMVSGVR
eukprot:227493-Rhodomonas_salina.2